MQQSGELQVSSRGQMSLPASARKRWGLEEGGRLGYIDLGDAVLFVPGGIEQLRASVHDEISPEVWVEARNGFGDPELANQ